MSAGCKFKVTDFIHSAHSLPVLFRFIFLISFFDCTLLTDKKVQDRVSQWRSKINAKILETLGETKVYLDGWPASCKILECNLGDMLTDSFIDYVGTVRKLVCQSDTVPKTKINHTLLYLHS